MREKILIDALEEIKTGHVWSSVSWLQAKAAKALSDYAREIKENFNDIANGRDASATKEGLQWVKASERLPDEFDKVHWRDNEGLPISAGIAYLEINRDKNLTIKWLDESPSSAPESGGEQEEKKMLAWSAWQATANAYRMYPDNKHTFFDYWENFGKEKAGDFVPNKSNSDVTPVASHSSTSFNSIEQIKYEKVFKFSTFDDWVNTAQQKFKRFKRWENDFREQIICLDINGNCLTLGEDFAKAEKEKLFPITAYRLIRTIEAQPNSEQEDKRSVASKADSSNDAGNQSGLTDK